MWFLEPGHGQRRVKVAERICYQMRKLAGHVRIKNANRDSIKHNRCRVCRVAINHFAAGDIHDGVA
jgi:hypothetical protein